MSRQRIIKKKKTLFTKEKVDNNFCIIDVSFSHPFIKINTGVIHDCFNECFSNTNLDRLNGKGQLLLLYDDKTVDETCKIDKKSVLCLFTLSQTTKQFNEIWNVCTPIDKRGHKYLRKLMDFYLKKYNTIDTKLYVNMNPLSDDISVSNPSDLIEIYKNLSFKISLADAESNLVTLIRKKNRSKPRRSKKML